MKTTAAGKREYARANMQVEGEIEIDEDAEVSPGDDPGAYVQAWVWVPKCDVPELQDEGSCRECGRECRIDENGVNNHVDEYGDIDHDADADHVAVMDGRGNEITGPVNTRSKAMRKFLVHVYAHVRCPVEVCIENASATPGEVAKIAVSEFDNDAERYVRGPQAEYAEMIDDGVLVDEVTADGTTYHGWVNLKESSKAPTVTLTVEELERLTDWAATGIEGWEDDDGEELDDDQRATKAEAEEFVDAIYDRIEAAKKK